MPRNTTGTLNPSKQPWWSTSSVPEFTAIIQSPVGKLGIIVQDECLTGIDFLGGHPATIAASDDVTREVVRQIHEYFANSKFRFDLPVKLEGTDFQKKVWWALQGIQSGVTTTYGTLARSINSGARAVGNSCRRNPLPIVIPCHRVIAASGIGGYAGHTQGPVLDRKHWLLQHESTCPLK